MAEEISLSMLEQISDKLGKDISEKISGFINKLKESGTESVKSSELIDNFGDKVGNAILLAADKAKKLSENLSEAFDKFNIFGNFSIPETSEIIDKFKNLTTEIGSTNNNLTKTIEVSGLALEPLFGLIPKSISGMKSIGDASYEAGMKASTAFEPFSNIFGDGAIGQRLKNLASATFEAHDNIIKLQRQSINLATAQGNLNAVVDETTGGFKNLDKQYDNIVVSAYQSAISTGRTVDSMMELQSTLSDIPGALQDIITIENKEMNTAIAATRIGDAFGRSQKEVATTLSALYTNMGISGVKALDSIAKMYDAAGNSKLRFEAFSSTVMDIAKSFNMLGDNTEAAIKVVKTFDDAFKGSNISPDAMQKVISGMTSGIEQLNLARGAFVSGATGGPGGLAGAYKMEYALETGNMEKVLGDTLKAMQTQFGGQILTLKEAAENPALAGEFYKQVQYLTQIAGVAKSDREAYKILEAMKTGVIDKLSLGKEGLNFDALAQSMDRGVDQQSVLQNTMMRIHQEAELTKLAQNKALVKGLDTISSTISSKTKGFFEVPETPKRAGLEDAASLASKTGIVLDLERSAAKNQALSDADLIDTFSGKIERASGFIKENYNKKISGILDQNVKELSNIPVGANLKPTPEMKSATTPKTEAVEEIRALGAVPVGLQAEKFTPETAEKVIKTIEDNVKTVSTEIVRERALPPAPIPPAPEQIIQKAAPIVLPEEKPVAKPITAITPPAANIIKPPEFIKAPEVIKIPEKISSNDIIDSINNQAGIETQNSRRLEEILSKTKPEAATVSAINQTINQTKKTEEVKNIAYKPPTVFPAVEMREYSEKAVATNINVDNEQMLKALGGFVDQISKIKKQEITVKSENRVAFEPLVVDLKFDETSLSKRIRNEIKASRNSDNGISQITGGVNTSVNG